MPKGPQGGPNDGGKLSGKELRSKLGKGSSVWRLFRYIFRNYKIRFGIVLLCIILSSLATLASSLFNKTLIDKYIVPMLSAEIPDYSPLAVALVKLGAILLAGTIASYASNLIMVFVSQGTMLGLRKGLFSHMESLPLSYFDSHSHGDIMSVYTNDVDTLRQMISQTIPNLFGALITIISTLISMLVLSLPLTVISLVMAYITFKITTSLGTRSKGYFDQRQKNLGIVNGFIEEMVEGQRVVKAYCHEEKAKQEFGVINENLRESVYKANRISSIIMPITGQLGNLSYVLIAFFGAIIVIGGYSGSWAMGLNGTAMSLGTIIAFLTLNKNFNRPISQVSNEINSIAMASAGSDRVYSLMDEASEVDEGKVELVNISDSMKVCGSRTGKWAWSVPSDMAEDSDGSSTAASDTDCAPADGKDSATTSASAHVNTGNKKLVKLEGKVSLEHVDFSYVPGKQVLFDISLTAYPGQKVAFVGGTGAGKTTITNLINRFYEIQKGRITYDGIDVRDIRKASLRGSLGMVLQETKLFTGTVIDNIRYGRLDASDEECKAAARLAHADNFIRHLPKGYNTELKADGGNLSQGERQLLAIARAAVADPPVLILDEATSSIDTRTEKLIQKGMDSLMKGRTTFVIAHRLSTVQNANYIIVLDHGRIIESGRHDELLASKGKYYQLYTGNQITS
jgi:ATP-binding cassette subfamily B protein